MLFQEKYLSDCFGLFKAKQDNTVQIYDEKDVTQVKKIGCIETFFGVTVNNGVKKFKWVIIAASFIWACFAFYLASKLTPLTKAEEFIPKEHEIMVV